MIIAAIEHALLALPGASVSSEPLTGPTPAGQERLQVHVAPRMGGVRVTIRIGDAQPYLLNYASEAEATARLEKLFTAVGEDEDPSAG